jgi:hypothetical protein
MTRGLSMPEANDASTTPAAHHPKLSGEARLHEALFDMEDPLRAMRSFIRMLAHVATSDHQVEADEYLDLEHHLAHLHTEVTQCWERAFEAVQELSKPERPESVHSAVAACLVQAWRAGRVKTEALAAGAGIVSRRRFPPREGERQPIRELPSHPQQPQKPRLA